MDAPPTIDAGADAPSDAGRIRGHLVLFGSGIWMVDDGFDRMFANAMFLSERPGDLDVVEYTEYGGSGSGWELHARQVMDDEAVARGRTLNRSTLTSASGLATALASADVLFVPVQSADEGTMRTIGMFWHDDLVSFLAAGGVVVVLSWPGLASNSYEYRLVDASDLFVFGPGGASGSFASSPPTVVALADTTDPIAAGVATPWAVNGSYIRCFPMSARGTVVVRTSDATLCPIVRHLVR
jgi:hypothetical protein